MFIMNTYKTIVHRQYMLVWHSLYSIVNCQSNVFELADMSHHTQINLIYRILPTASLLRFYKIKH